MWRIEAKIYLLLLLAAMVFPVLYGLHLKTNQVGFLIALIVLAVAWIVLVIRLQQESDFPIWWKQRKQPIWIFLLFVLAASLYAASMMVIIIFSPANDTSYFQNALFADIAGKAGLIVWYIVATDRMLPDDYDPGE